MTYLNEWDSFPAQWLQNQFPDAVVEPNPTGGNVAPGHPEPNPTQPPTEPQS